MVQFVAPRSYSYPHTLGSSSLAPAGLSVVRKKDVRNLWKGQKFYISAHNKLTNWRKHRLSVRTILKPLIRIKKAWRKKALPEEHMVNLVHEAVHHLTRQGRSSLPQEGSTEMRIKKTDSKTHRLLKWFLQGFTHQKNPHLYKVEVKPTQDNQLQLTFSAQKQHETGWGTSLQEFGLTKEDVRSKGWRARIPVPILDFLAAINVDIGLKLKRTLAKENSATFIISPQEFQALQKNLSSGAIDARHLNTILNQDHLISHAHYKHQVRAANITVAPYALFTATGSLAHIVTMGPTAVLEGPYTTVGASMADASYYHQQSSTLVLTKQKEQQLTAHIGWEPQLTLTALNLNIGDFYLPSALTQIPARFLRRTYGRKRFALGKAREKQAVFFKHNEPSEELALKKFVDKTGKAFFKQYLARTMAIKAPFDRLRVQLERTHPQAIRSLQEWQAELANDPGATYLTAHVWERKVEGGSYAQTTTITPQDMAYLSTHGFAPADDISQTQDALSSQYYTGLDSTDRVRFALLVRMNQKGKIVHAHTLSKDQLAAHLTPEKSASETLQPAYTYPEISFPLMPPKKRDGGSLEKWQPSY